MKIRIKGDRKSEAIGIFEGAGIAPIRIVDREDGDVTFEIGALSADREIDLLESIPKEYFALQARIHG